AEAILAPAAEAASIALSHADADLSQQTALALKSRQTELAQDAADYAHAAAQARAALLAAYAAAEAALPDGGEYLVSLPALPEAPDVSLPGISAADAD